MLRDDDLKFFQHENSRQSIADEEEEINEKGLCFCGYRRDVSVMLREIGIEARQLAKKIKERNKTKRFSTPLHKK